MPASVNLVFKAREDLSLRGIGGEQVHGLFLNLIREQDHELSHRLHDGDRIRPFSLSPVIGGRKSKGRIYLRAESPFRIKYCVLEDGLHDNLYKTFTALSGGKRHYHLGESGIELINSSGGESGFGMTFVSYESLAEGADESDEIQLRFLSPTAFKDADRQIVFPEPGLVFKSLLNKWNTFSGCPLEFPEGLFGEMMVKKYRLRTELLEYGTHRTTGCVGGATYLIPRSLGDYARKINTLADYARYAGIGYQTTKGMGQAVRTTEDDGAGKT